MLHSLRVFQGNLNEVGNILPRDAVKMTRHFLDISVVRIIDLVIYLLYHSSYFILEMVIGDHV